MEQIQINKEEEPRLVNQALHELFLGLQIDHDHYYSLKLTHKIYQNYGQRERANKVAYLLQNRSKGIKNSSTDIIEAMKNRDDEFRKP